MSYIINIGYRMIWLSLIVYAISMFLPFCYIIECLLHRPVMLSDGITFLL